MKHAIAVLQHHGIVQFQQSSPDQPLHILFQLHGFRPHATHAIHIHEFGDIRQGCTSLGSHFNPTQRDHPYHAGDLFHNFQTDTHGEFHFVYPSPILSLFPGDSCILGRSIVIHQFPDDYGLKGVSLDHQTLLYRDMTTQELTYMSTLLGYPVQPRDKMIRKLEQESATTGNASTRIDYGIIGLAKPN